jgi:hypothetical protein
VGGQTCTVINTTLTTVQCQISSIPSTTQSQYQGKTNSFYFLCYYHLSILGSRGLQLYHTSSATSQVN